MRFPDDGDYVFPGALAPLHVRDGIGLHLEPNVWLRHHLPGSRTTSPTRSTSPSRSSEATASAVAPLRRGAARRAGRRHSAATRVGGAAARRSARRACRRRRAPRAARASRARRSAVLRKAHRRPLLPVGDRRLDQHRARRDRDDLAADPLVHPEPRVEVRAVLAAPLDVALDRDQRVALLERRPHRRDHARAARSPRPRRARVEHPCWRGRRPLLVGTDADREQRDDVAAARSPSRARTPRPSPAAARRPSDGSGARAPRRPARRRRGARAGTRELVVEPPPVPPPHRVVVHVLGKRGRELSWRISRRSGRSA